MATTKKAKALKRGDRVLVKDRLWGIVNSEGKLIKVAGDYGEVAIYSTRADALQRRGHTERLIRLPDLDCEVV